MSSKTKVHLIRYIDYWETQLVLDRIPEYYRKRVRRIILLNASRGVRRLGCVKACSRRDIYLFPWLPPRVSLRGFIYRGQSAAEFGAPRVGQWTPWAVRRFLLYDVLLHELGHLQEVYPNKKKMNRRFANEAKAEEFADYWRRTLYSEHTFEHPDIIHHPPSEQELAFLEVWAVLDKSQRYEVAMMALGAEHKLAEPKISFLQKLPADHRKFLELACKQHSTRWHYHSRSSRCIELPFRFFPA